MQTLQIHTPYKVAYTFGAPRATNEDFHDAFAAHIGTVFRIVNNLDPVPHMVPYNTGTLGFEHLRGEVWFFPRNGRTVYKLCSEDEDLSCSLGAHVRRAPDKLTDAMSDQALSAYVARVIGPAVRVVD